jgi:hypothetical protein
MNKEGIRIKLSPVPARESVQLQYAAKEAGNCELRITDAAGKVCQAISFGQQKDGNIRISLSTLPSGVYYVQLRIGESIATAGFIRQ